MILLEISLETIVVWLESRRIIKVSSTEWFGNHTLQLQRMAHEELGLGEWEGCKGSANPVTQKGQLLGIFSTEDPEHPRLVKPNAASRKPKASANANESGNQSTAADGSETEVNETPPAVWQDDSSSRAGHGSTGNSAAGHQDNSPPEGIATSAPEESAGSANSVALPEPSGQRPLSETEAPSDSPNASPTELSALPIPARAHIVTVSEV